MRFTALTPLGFVVSLATSTILGAQTTAQHKQILALVNQNSAHYQQVSKQIWDFAEVGYHEDKSSKTVTYKSTIPEGQKPPTGLPRIRQIASPTTGGPRQAF